MASNHWKVLENRERNEAMNLAVKIYQSFYPTLYPWHSWDKHTKTHQDTHSSSSMRTVGKPSQCLRSTGFTRWGHVTLARWIKQKEAEHQGHPIALFSSTSPPFFLVSSSQSVCVRVTSPHTLFVFFVFVFFVFLTSFPSNSRCQGFSTASDVALNSL